MDPNKLCSYRAIMMDPPWRYRAGPGIRGAADKHYKTMTVEEIRDKGKQDLPLLEHPGGSHLWMWITVPFLLEGTHQYLMNAWGYTPKTASFWVKGKLDIVRPTDELFSALWRTVRRIVRDPDDPRAMWSALRALIDILPVNLRLHTGQGHYTRGAVEVLVLGTKGDRLTPPTNEAVPNVLFSWPGRHSAKPAEQYSLIERVSPGPYLELYARNRHHGWDAQGLELSDAT